MIEMKELQAFVVCADVHSFSKAADVLYTSQPNISKMIRHLEAKLGFSLFTRDNKGIRLTTKGKSAYEYASRIVSEGENLSNLLQMDEREEFCVATNPSSWVSDLLTDYYRKYRRDRVRYCFLEGSVNNVIDLVGNGKAELGFVFFRDGQRNGIDYKMQRQQVVFTEMKRVQMWLYFGKGRKKEVHSDTQAVSSDIRLIQSYEDEFALNHYWDQYAKDDNDHELTGRVSVLTNSDYIMNRMLERTDLCNISGWDLGDESEFSGKPAGDGEEEVVFGYLQRERDEISESAGELLGMLKDRI